LDEDPQVLQMLEAARREVLARAYQDRIAAQATRASSDDIDRFYEGHPELFSQRRIYTLQEYAIDASVAQIAPLVAAVPAAQAPQRIEDKLAEARLPHRSRIYAQAAEDMPLALLQKIYSLAPGRPLLIEQPVGARLFILLHAEPAPVSRQIAIPSIGGYLVTERQRREVQARMKSLRDAATITYSPAFAGSAPAAAQAAPATAVR
jgi:EpsD family peptidyl-prolyl cis-trans isomerase